VRAEDARASLQTFDDVLRDFALSVETVANTERMLLHISRKTTGEALQTIDIIQKCFGDPGFYAGDFDFDGHEDFACKSGARHTAFFLYDAQKERFAFSFELIGFDISSDRESRTLTSIDRDKYDIKKRIYQMHGSRPVLTEECYAPAAELQPNFRCWPVATPKSVLRNFYFEYDGCQSDALRIYRKETGDLMQTIENAECCVAGDDIRYEEPPVGVLDYRWASTLYAGDFNFDGLEDFAVNTDCGNVNCGKTYYLYDPGRRQFRRAFALSGHSIYFDPATKTVTTSSRGNAATHYQNAYRVEGFRLTPKYACVQTINLGAPDQGIGATLSGDDFTLDLSFGHDEDGVFSGSVAFSDKTIASPPRCPLRLKDKKVLAYNEEGQAQRVAWTLDVHCGFTLFGTLSLILSDIEDEWIKASYRQLGDGKVIPFEWGYFCSACGTDGKDCEDVD
jgi:hypothetical protein